MPRGPRRDAPGCAHHVIVRGIDGCRIFRDGEDRLDFLGRLDHLLPEGSWRCFAWALMPNHVHLVLASAEGGLSRLMARLNTGYARSFNLRHDRTGYLFENRFKSRLAEDDVDLMGLVVYAHRNPLAAGLVRSHSALERYPWCGHSALVGNRPPLEFESIEASLSLFGGEEAVARRRLREAMLRPASESTDVACPNEDERVQWPSSSLPVKRRSRSSVRYSGPARYIEVQASRGDPLALEELISKLSRLFGVSLNEVCSPCQRRAPARARAAVAYLAVEGLGLPGRAVAMALRVSPSAVSHALHRGRVVVVGERIRLASGGTESDGERS